MRTSLAWVVVATCVLALWGCAAPTVPVLPPTAVLDLGPEWPEALPDTIAAEVQRAAMSHRVLALGEGDHFVAEKYEYRLAFLRLLVQHHGVRHVALEMGASDAGRIDRYLETGDERWLHRVVLHGYAGEDDDERRELAPVTRGDRRPPDDAWAEAERSFFRKLRELGLAQGARLHVAGFDFDAAPGGGYADARRSLESCADTPAVRALRVQLTPPRNTTPTLEVSRLDQLITQLTTERTRLDADCGATQVDAARAALDQLASSYRTFFEWRASQADTSAQGPLRMRRMFDERESQMHARYRRWAQSLPVDARVVLLGHDMHVARDSEVLRYGRAPHDLPMWRSLGTRIEQDHPGSLWVCWLLYGEGTRYMPTSRTGLSVVQPRPDSLEATLARTAGRYFVRMERVPAGSVVDQSWPFGTETSEGLGPVRTVTDAIVFLPQAHAPGPTPR
ncbi:hypothetical protein MYSTI_05587 [Myxococcus stipitatus DSM 14675]|uniref:Erythromycin esterase n=1 Tax=Myxococcus stipitatus (strain DSM 14675 / JCM 12634 / Mx s8) TaxID=1278073 RepID=L7UK79_MYXSD|nr:erythromycin esterase family protein [Myxococcus stipitatus]AGC46864.1 hypothetical protein MYSTI_05587 [Myxococcus stipitatus DSM 14675]